jgi:hypothetical protein
MASYVIQHKLKENTFWSNEHGWTGIDEATFFTEKERKETDHIPADSVWQPLWCVDLVQFARFIAECDDVGLFGSTDVADVAAEMDLDVEDIYKLLERAHDTFDQFKSKLRS